MRPTGTREALVRYLSVPEQEEREEPKENDLVVWGERLNMEDLLHGLVTEGTSTDPVSGREFEQDVLEKLERLSLRNRVTVIIVDTRFEPFSRRREKVMSLDSFRTVLDVAILASDDGSFKNDLIDSNGESLFSMPPLKTIKDYSPTMYVRVVDSSPNKPLDKRFLDALDKSKLYSDAVAGMAWHPLSYDEGTDSVLWEITKGPPHETSKAVNVSETDVNLQKMVKDYNKTRSRGSHGLSLGPRALNLTEMGLRVPEKIYVTSKEKPIWSPSFPEESETTLWYPFVTKGVNGLVWDVVTLRNTDLESPSYYDGDVDDGLAHDIVNYVNHGEGKEKLLVSENIGPTAKAMIVNGDKLPTSYL